MIVVLYGQPGAGKTTLGKLLYEEIMPSVIIDGDNLRELFKNNDYSKEGRIKNLNRASDIAVYINSLDIDAIVCMIYPYQECRDYLNSLCKNVIWIHLTYEGIRGREHYHTPFDYPLSGITINTSDKSIEESLKIIQHEIYPLLSARQ